MVAISSLLLGALMGVASLASAVPQSPAAAESLLTTRADPSSPGCGQTPFASGTKSVTVNGKNRQFVVRVPTGYDNKKPYRVIFAFHWNGGSMNDVATGGSDKELWAYYGMQRQGGDQAILVAPNGLGGGWANSGGEDIAFVDAMIKFIDASLCVNQRQRFSMGFSYGAAMSYSIACSRAKDFRGIVAISGGVLSGCSGGNEPLAFYGIHGISDGTLGIGSGRSLRDRFVKNNGCQSTNAPEPSRGQPHTETWYKGCKTGYPVVWSAFDGGHGPGPVDGGGDSGAKSWVPAAVWKFYTSPELTA